MKNEYTQFLASLEIEADYELMSDAQTRTAYEAGRTLSDIGSECGLSNKTIRKKILAAGGTMRQPYTRQIDYPVERWVEDYEAGKSAVQIAREYGVSSNSVYARLATAGVTMRPQGTRGVSVLVTADHNFVKPNPRRKARVTVATSTLADSYEAGKSLTDIAYEHGISHMTVRRRLAKAGITIRSQGSRKAPVTN